MQTVTQITAGKKFNGQLYGNAIYVNGEKIVLTPAQIALNALSTGTLTTYQVADILNKIEGSNEVLGAFGIVAGSFKGFEADKEFTGSRQSQLVCKMVGSNNPNLITICGNSSVLEFATEDETKRIFAIFNAANF